MERKFNFATGKLGVIEFEKAVWRKVFGEEMPEDRLAKLMVETPEGIWVMDEKEGWSYEGSLARI